MNYGHAHANHEVVWSHTDDKTSSNS